MKISARNGAAICAPEASQPITKAAAAPEARIAPRGLRQPGSDGAPDLVANPIRYRHDPLAHPAAPPALGADTDAMLARHLGLGADEIARLRAQSIV